MTSIIADTSANKLMMGIFISYVYIKPTTFLWYLFRRI